MQPDENLRAEYLLIQAQYEAFDQRALALKALAAPLLGAGIAVGLKEGSRSVVLATILVALSIWLLEAIWKAFQYCLSGRIVLLETWFRSEGADPIAPFQIYTSWNREWRGGLHRWQRWLVIMRQPFVALPYAVIVAFGAAALVWLSR